MDNHTRLSEYEASIADKAEDEGSSTGANVGSIDVQSSRRTAALMQSVVIQFTVPQTRGTGGQARAVMKFSAVN